MLHLRALVPQWLTKHLHVGRGLEAADQSNFIDLCNSAGVEQHTGSSTRGAWRNMTAPALPPQK